MWLDFDEINSRARAHAETVMRHLAGDIKLENGNICACNPTRDDETPNSFKYSIRKDIWKDFATDDGGKGLISLWVYIYGVPYHVAAQELSDFLDGLAGCEGVSPSKVSNPSKVSVDHQIAHIVKNAIEAENTPVEVYLRSRGIICPIPPAIRFLERCWHSPTKQFLPAMVAALCPTYGENKYHVSAFLRTYLKEDGLGKADVEPNKMMLGSSAGMSVPLRLPSAETIAVGEGIETCLSFQQATDIPTFAAISTTGLMAFVPPELSRGTTIIIAADNDPPGLSAAHVAASNWLAQGRKVKIVTPPDGFNDFNDLLRRKP